MSVWDVQARRELVAPSGYTGTVGAVCFSPDGRTLVAARGDDTVRFRDLRTARQRASLNWQVGEAHVLAVAPDGMRAAVGGDADIVLWDLDDGS